MSDVTKASPELQGDAAANQGLAELRSCPWCGTADHLVNSPCGSLTADMPSRPYRVVCTHIDCDQVQGPVGYGCFQSVALWNTRAADAELDQLRAENERLRGILANPTKAMLDAGMDAAEDALDSDYSSNIDGDRDYYSYLRSDAPAKIWAAMVAALGEQP